MLYILGLYNSFCQLYPNKAGKKNLVVVWKGL